jgi:hypothetical protein
MAETDLGKGDGGSGGIGAGLDHEEEEIPNKV